MQILKSLKKTIVHFLNTYKCPQTGFLYQWVGREKVFLRSRSEYLSNKTLSKLCNYFYYKNYMPRENDLVVCIGAGLGHEAIWLKNKVTSLKYIGVEIQPYVYELLSNTFKSSAGFSACSLAIDNNLQNMFISSATDYTAVTSEKSGYIEIHSISWDAFIAKYKINHINLLQINIEGAERYLLPMINNFTNIEHIIVSAHDFRADRGDGEYFRTREFVRNFLVSKGYLVTACGTKPRHEDWLFASKQI